MNYEPLALKYRPQTLNDLAGQDSVRQTLGNAIINNKLAHAYLFTGPRGAGKTSTARILAKCLNCAESPTTNPCGECPSCVSITNASSIDVIEIDAASHGHVEDARLLIERVNLASVAGKYKIYIIDEVHMLSNAAFNALLKVFEEPPPQVLFILATTEGDKVLGTIASRCQRLNFKPINETACLQRLRHVVEQENINIADTALELIVKKADGALRDALGLLDQISVYSSIDSVIGVDKVLEIIGGVAEEDLRELTELLITREPVRLLEKLKQVFDSGKDVLNICKGLMLSLLQILENNNDTQADKNVENFELVQMIDVLSELEFKLKQSTQPKNILRASMLKLAHRADIVIIKDLQQRISKLEEIVYSSAKNSNKATPYHTPSLTQYHTESVSPADDFIQYLSPACRGLYISSKARLAKVENSTALIQIPIKFKFLKSKLEDKSGDIMTAINKASLETSQDQINSINVEISDSQESIVDLIPSQNPQSSSQPAREIMELFGDFSDPSAVNQSSSELDEAIAMSVSVFGAKLL